MTPPDPDLDREIAELRSGIRRATWSLVIDGLIVLGLVVLVAELIWRAS